MCANAPVVVLYLLRALSSIGLAGVVGETACSTGARSTPAACSTSSLTDHPPHCLDCLAALPQCQATQEGHER